MNDSSYVINMETLELLHTQPSEPTASESVQLVKNYSIEMTGGVWSQNFLISIYSHLCH